MSEHFFTKPSLVSEGDVRFPPRFVKELVVAAAIVIAAATPLGAELDQLTPPSSIHSREPQDVSQQLETIRDDHDIPAIAAAVVDEGQLVAVGVAGVRNAKVPVHVTMNDKWHIGSITKSMTASVAAMLVEEHKLRWNSKISEVFSELGDAIEDDWRDVTLEQLFYHRGGAPHDPPGGLWKAALAQRGTPTEQRYAFVKGLLAREPAVKPGTRWIYSDSGYAIAGAMMERVTGTSWEELLKTRLFDPLGMTSAGFGPPSEPDKLDQPWGHRGYDAPYRPVSPGPDADYPPAIGPAASVHCTIADLAIYANWHVAGARGDARLLTAESFRKLHTPAAGQDYAMGWAITKRKWAGGIALMHSGENTMFYATMWLGPGENTAFVAAANADSPDAQQACEEAIRRLINEF